MKLKNIALTLAALCGFFIAQNAQATCDNYVTYSDGQVLTAGSLNSLQTNYTNCINGILDGDIFTGNMSWYSGSDILVYSDTGSTQKFSVDGATGNTSVAGTFSATGSSTFDTSTLYVDATNNRVGVLTTSPQTSLTVGENTPGTAEATYKGTVQIATSTGSTSSAGGLEFKSSADSSGYGWRIGAPDLTSGNVPLIFMYRGNSASWTELFRGNNDGTFVIGGVGTSIDATNLLQVYKSSSGANVNSLTRNISNTSGSNANVVASVAGTSGGDPAFLLDITGATGWYLAVDNSDLDTFKIGTGSAVGTNNYLQIGTTGRIYFPSHNTTASGANAYLDSSTGELMRSTSSQRYKENITDIELDTSKIYNLRPVSYDDKTNHQRYFGLIAEEVEEIFPQLVDHNKDGDPEYVFYERLSVLLLAEMKNLKTENEALKARLTAGGL